jgi:hypothetical protein
VILMRPRARSSIACYVAKPRNTTSIPSARLLASDAASDTISHQNHSVRALA